MLRIREPQMEALRAVVADEFARATAAELRRALPEATAAIDDRDLRALVTLGVEKAPRYDLLAPAQIKAFVAFLVRFGATIDEAPDGWAGSVLRDGRLSPGDKLAELEARAPGAGPRRGARP